MMNYRIRQGNILFDGKSIFTQLYIPLNKKPPFIPVILSHGFGGSYAEMAPYAADLAKIGYLALVYDFTGGSTFSRSSGSTMEMTITNQCDDLTTMIQWIRLREDVDQDKLVVIGESQGGLVSALVGVDHPQWFNHLILIYPAFCIPDDARRKYPNKKNIPSRSEFWGTPLSANYYLDVYDLDIYSKLNGYTKPVLIVHGSKDHVVDISYSQKAVQAYPNATLIPIANADHGFRGKQRDMASAIIIDYLKRH